MDIENMSNDQKAANYFHKMYHSLSNPLIPTIYRYGILNNYAYEISIGEDNGNELFCITIMDLNTKTVEDREEVKVTKALCRNMEGVEEFLASTIVESSLEEEDNNN